MDKEKNISLDYLYRSTWQLISKMYNEQAEKKDINMTIAFVLVNIDYKNGTPSTSLGPKMGIEPTSLSRTLKKMEDDKIIFRTKNPHDGRSVLIKLTDEGKRQRDIAKQVILQFNESVKKDISDEDLSVFISVNQKIQQAIIDKKIF